jgi:LCP family protein required for cell wall assembly
MGRRIFLGVIMLLVLGTVGVLGYTGLSPVQAWKLLVEGVGMVGNKVHPKPPFGGRQKLTILLLGTDVSFNDAGTARSDTIKVVTVEVKPPRVAILSIPRDTWVEIPGHGHRRINSAYQVGGEKEADRIALAGETITGLLRELTGEEVTFDHFLRIQTGGFMHIVDAMGGVTIDVEKQMDYEDPSQKLFIHLKPGVQRLNGEQAMGYVRFRHDAESDFGRIRRQDQFIAALKAQLTDPKERLRVARAIGPAMKMLKTDLSLSDMMALKEIAGQADGIQSVRLLTKSTRKGAAQVEEVDTSDEAVLAVRDVLHGPRPTVVVLNGTGKRGMADKVGDRLDTAAFNLIATGTTEAQPATAIYTGASKQAAAVELAASLGFDPAVVKTDGTVPTADYGRADAPTTPPAFTIVLGSDYLRTPKPAAAHE